MSSKKKDKYADNRKAILEGCKLAGTHPLIEPLPSFQMRLKDTGFTSGRHGWLRAECSGHERDIWLGTLELIVDAWPNVRRNASAEEWAYAFARLRLHIVLNHFDPQRTDMAWHLACWCRAEELMSFAGVGIRPADWWRLPEGLPRGDEAALAQYLSDAPPLPELETLSLGESGQPFWSVSGDWKITEDLRKDHGARLARGIRAAASEAVDIAGGARKALGEGKDAETVVRRALRWVISEFPLLAALASSFKLIEDAELCRSMDVGIAAIWDETQEIYVNPDIKFTEDEARFVMAHELLHAGLRHTARRQGRDHWFWNVACDFVINDWLLEMKVGVFPDRLGLLHDPSLRGQSAEEVYDRIVTDLRWMRKLKKAHTLNGRNSDMLEGDRPPGWWNGGGVDLDAFYRRALAGGLELHLGSGRGFLPTGLVEEIRSLSQPPIPWDVELAHWLDQFFPPLERRRSFARAHRRQSATPDIARPGWICPDEERASRVFGAIVDTSGSMTRADLGKAVGAIASYAMSRDVGYVRLVQCDAAAHDAGYVEPTSLLERIQVRGRGGTVLMPGIRMLERAEDFPPDGPILVITDGYCDHLRINRQHAYVLAPGGRLSFPAKGPVFRLA